MKNKILVITFITLSFLLSSIFFSVLFINDPLKLFHKPWKYEQYLQRNMRQQAAGILNNWEYDSIILGTSMLENTSSREASKILNGKFINISISGSDYFERAIVLNYVLKKQKIKKILYSLDSMGLVNFRKGHNQHKIHTWDYLYDNNPFNDFNAYMNNKYLKCLFSISSKKECIGRKVNFDRPNAWYTSKVHIVRFGGLDNWFKAKNNSQIKAAFKSILRSVKQIENGKIRIDQNLKSNILKSQKYIDNTLIKFVSKYLDTEFILVLPPYSRMKYAMMAQYDISSFERYKASIKYLVNKSKKYSNLKIYGWGNHSFVDNIANYKDLSHYEYKINSWMLDAIKREEGLLSVNNIDNYLDIFTQKALDYNLFELGNKIDKYLYPRDKKIFKYQKSKNEIKIFDINDIKYKYYKSNRLTIIKKKLTTTHHDPIIILNKLKTKSEFVRLNYNLDSSVKTVFQLFYKENKSTKYTENNSYKVAIKKGKNKISLSIPAKYINNQLRVDLVSKIGKYKINDFSIYEVEEPVK